jgi:hypothetical protein
MKLLELLFDRSGDIALAVAVRDGAVVLHIDDSLAIPFQPDDADTLARALTQGAALAREGQETVRNLPETLNTPPEGARLMTELAFTAPETSDPNAT